jgi:predicted PurR-regulated permease PerM
MGVKAKDGAMALPTKDQFRYWGIALAVFLVLLWFLGNVLLPFIVGGAVAYFLDPLADRLERMGLSRTAATTVISLVALLGVILLVLAVIPTLVNQLTALVNAAPDIAKRLQGFLLERFPDRLRTAPRPSGRHWPRSGPRFRRGAGSWRRG